MSPKTMPSAERAAIGRMDWTDGRLLSPRIDVTPSTPQPHGNPTLFASRR